jgi:hypothetical protein
MLKISLDIKTYVNIFSIPEAEKGFLTRRRRCTLKIKAFRLKFGKSELSVEEASISPYILLAGLVVVLVVVTLSTVA